MDTDLPILSIGILARKIRKTTKEARFIGVFNGGFTVKDCF
jgi:hypothetical protein